MMYDAECLPFTEFLNFSQIMDLELTEGKKEYLVLNKHLVMICVHTFLISSITYSNPDF